MRTVGIVVEYNPFHNGHLYHLQQAKTHTNADAVVAVMSGDFLQRGEPAIVSKWARTEMALHAGVDLVIELPSIYAVSAAERFAYGAMRTFEATGIVDTLCFGSEHGDIKPFLTLADHMTAEPDHFREHLHTLLSQGISYPKAFSQAIQTTWPNHTAFDATLPNNTLGLFYTLALRRLSSAIIPTTITRIASDFRDAQIQHESIASATALRALLKQDVTAISPYVPASTLDILQRCFASRQGPMSWDAFITPLLHQLAISSTDELRTITDVSEGLEHRLKQSIYELPDTSFGTLLATLETKRYTKTHLQRILTNILLKRSNPHDASYIRVLGFTSRGQQLLKNMRKKATAPIISRVTKQHFALLESDLQAAYSYALGYPQPTRELLRRELIQSPVVRK